jgi:hypothetical protein
MKLKKIIFVFCFIILIACSKKKLGSTEYIKYIEDENNGLKTTKSIGRVNYSLQYKPADYIILKENRELTDLNEDLKEMQYYTLQYSLIDNSKDILKFNLNASNEYYERVNYFSFGLQNDIYLVDGTDTLECKLFNYVRSYGLSPKADFVLAFDVVKKDKIENKQLVIDDKVYGGSMIKLFIDKKDINNIPELIRK